MPEEAPKTIPKDSPKKPTVVREYSISRKQQISYLDRLPLTKKQKENILNKTQ